MGSAAAGSCVFGIIRGRCRGLGKRGIVRPIIKTLVYKSTAPRTRRAMDKIAPGTG